MDFLIWERRIKIAIDIARALEFLHLGGVTQSVIHGDVKSSNILLSEDFGARVNIQPGAISRTQVHASHNLDLCSEYIF